MKLEIFEGPMDLLCRLIDKEEINIYDIPIRELAAQYLEVIAQMSATGFYDMDGMSSFILMAATLIEIKSKMLLPLPKKDADDEDVEDPREELVRRLVEYKLFKAVAAAFAERETLSVFREAAEKLDLPASERVPSIAEMLDGLTERELYAAYNDAAMRKELKTDKIRAGFNAITTDLYTVEQKIIRILELLTESDILSFFNILESAASREEKVVSFLAILELVKIGKAYVAQESNFKDIIIRRQSIGGVLNEQ